MPGDEESILGDIVPRDCVDRRRCMPVTPRSGPWELAPGHVGDHAELLARRVRVGLGEDGADQRGRIAAFAGPYPRIVDTGWSITRRAAA
jgi:hypothetical protein